ncbi:MAG: universal stress protein [Chloroflexota bacterium]|nr:MAG: universal stress protein [Chloroflexota bacterium]
MTQGEREKAIRRILVALDASPHSLAALRAAAELASRLDAEIIGVFVEDIRLLRVAESPLARQVTSYSRTMHAFDTRQIERELRAQAERARRTMALLAARARLRSSFQVARGEIAAELLRYAAEADMIFLGRTGWSGKRQLGSTTRIIIDQSPRQTMILGQVARLGLQLGLVYDGSEKSLPALQAAANLVMEANAYLTVLILANHPDTARQYQTEASAWLSEHGLSASFHWLVNTSINVLVSLLRTENLGALVIPTGSEAVPVSVLAELIDKIDIPILLAR